MNRYKSFYYLHIDKTIGPVTGIKMFDPLYKKLSYYGVDASLNKDHKLHNYWRDLDEDTFIFCAIRDPFYRTVSEFCYETLYNEDGYRKYYEWRDRYTKQLSVDKFEEWLDNRFVPNYQYKIIDNGGNYLKNKSRINMMVRADDIYEKENYIQNLILRSFEIEDSMPKYTKDVDPLFMQELSMVFFLEYLKDNRYVDIVNRHNRLDLELYNSIPRLNSVSL